MDSHEGNEGNEANEANEGYWTAQPLSSGMRMVHTILLPSIQMTPMVIVSRSRGGAQIVCLSEDNKLYIAMHLPTAHQITPTAQPITPTVQPAPQTKTWKVIGTSIPVNLNSPEDLYGVCMGNPLVYIVLRCGQMATISVEAHFKGEQCKWDSQEVTRIVGLIDARRSHIVDTLMQKYTIDASSAPFVDFMLIYDTTQTAPTAVTTFFGRPRFSRDVKKRECRSPMLPAGEESICIATLICVLSELCPRRDLPETWNVGCKVIRVYSETKAAGILSKSRNSILAIAAQLRRWVPFVKVLAKITNSFKNHYSLEEAVAGGAFNHVKKSLTWIMDRANRVELFMRNWIDEGQMASDIFTAVDQGLTMSNWIQTELVDMLYKSTRRACNMPCKLGAARSNSVGPILDKHVVSISAMKTAVLACTPPSQIKESKRVSKAFNCLLQDMVAHARDTQLIMQAATMLADSAKRARICENQMRDDIRDLVHASSIQYPDAARVPDMISHGLKEIENAAMREIHNVFETNQVWTMETVQATFAPLIQFSRPFP